ncbi:sulfatase [Marinifilum breve]|uniref:Sulfatase n=1 Tax=Marinifilum breve TaxID=2184082 RepID=A0A2V4AB79_9BACT|nr:sulfatase [Marinifilum breve]PXY01224.1 sulfatase [Marinifilum breve]
MKYNRLFLCILIAFFAIGCKQKSTSKISYERPNIIFIMSDDHAYQAIGAYGSKMNETPNIDRLANEGMRFDKAFVTNSICSPSRAVVLTGKHSHLNGVRDNINVFDSTQQTYPKLLQKAGYETAVIGKWHLKSQPTGFDYWKVLPDQGHYYNPDFRTPEGIVQEQGYVTDIITDMALEWLDVKRDKAKPFMMMYHHKAPHREWLPAMEHLTDFKADLIAEPESLFDDYKGRGRAAKEAEMKISDHMGLSNDNKMDPKIVKSLGFEQFMGWYEGAYRNNLARMTEKEKAAWNKVYGPINRDFEKNTPRGKDLIRWKYQRYMQDYLACIKSVDENIGRVLDYLEERGLAENTIVVYTSDQGFYLGEHGWFDKRFMYEESFRTPLLVRWPRMIKSGTVNSDLVQNLDFAETFLDAAGVEIPKDMQGKSMLPLFEGNNQNWRDAVYYHYWEYPGIHAVKRHYGLRTKTHKLIHFYYDIDEWELYDLEKDPNEMMNLIDDPSYELVKQDLIKKLENLRKQYHDTDSLNQAILKSDLNR